MPTGRNGSGPLLRMISRLLILYDPPLRSSTNRSTFPLPHSLANTFPWYSAGSASSLYAVSPVGDPPPYSSIRHSVHGLYGLANAAGGSGAFSASGLSLFAFCHSDRALSAAWCSLFHGAIASLSASGGRYS